MRAACPRGEFVGFDHSLYKRVRGFLWRAVSDTTADGSVRVLSSGYPTFYDQAFTTYFAHPTTTASHPRPTR